MIKSDKGESKIEGNLHDLIFEFVTLYKHAIKVMPEVVTPTILAYGDELKKAYTNCSTGECMIVKMQVEVAKEIIDNGRLKN